MPQNLSSLTSYFPQSVEQFQTSLAQPASYGAATIYLTTLTGSYSSYNNSSIAILAVDAGNSKQNVVVGTVNTSNNTLTNCVWTEGGNNSHLAGATVADFTTATSLDMITMGLLKQHNQNGSHGAITTSSISNSGTLNQSGAISGAGFSTATITNPYKFSVYWAAGQGSYMTTAATGYITKYDTKIFDPNNNYSTANYNYTCPIAGFYQFNFLVTINTGATGMYADGALHQNASQVLAVESQGNSIQTQPSVSGSILLQCAAGDAIHVETSAGQGGIGIIGGQAYANFNGFLVSAT